MKWVCSIVAFFIVAQFAAADDEVKLKYPGSFDLVALADYSSLTEPERVVYCIGWLEAEVNNGGFHQFFLNSTGKYANETVAALRTIEALKTARLLIQAIAIAYPYGFPDDPSNHQEALIDDEETMDKLDKLDQEFYRYEEDISLLVNRHLAK